MEVNTVNKNSPQQVNSVNQDAIALLLQGVKKRFGTREIYRSLDLDVRRGETITVLGPSGVGKSVMLKLIIGLLHADAVGALGGLVVGWLPYGVPPRLFVSGVEDFVTIGDFGSGLVKATVFGAIVGSISCGAGIGASGGTEGVGRATTRAVVAAALTVLAADFLLTKAMLTL